MDTVPPSVGCRQAIQLRYSSDKSACAHVMVLTARGSQIIGYNDFAHDARRKLYVKPPSL
jgi:hypothetical protein